MTVSSTPTGIVYNITALAAGTEYAFSFPYIEVENVKAYYRHDSTDAELSYGVDYSVKNNLNFTAFYSFESDRIGCTNCYGGFVVRL